VSATTLSCFVEVLCDSPLFFVGVDHGTSTSGDKSSVDYQLPSDIACSARKNLQI
jgi:hypothetical protein